MGFFKAKVDYAIAIKYVLQQRVIGFHRDEQGDWVAELGCGHGYHMRHDPPWLVREWVLTSEGREKFLGHVLDCKKCDQAFTNGPP